MAGDMILYILYYIACARPVIIELNIGSNWLELPSVSNWMCSRLCLACLSIEELVWEFNAA